MTVEGQSKSIWEKRHFW